MSKDYGPKGFEKAWIKALNGFAETKIFFEHDSSKTTIKYIDGDQLLGVEMFRCQFELDNWLNHFQHYLDTGVFDTNAYWVEYKSVKNNEGGWDNVTITDPTPIPMELSDKLWDINSPEMDKFMDDERESKGDLGFRHVSR